MSSQTAELESIADANDLELLHRYVRTGDAGAFAQLAARHRDMVYATCLRVLGNRADAEDAAQNCFLQLARDARRIRVSLVGWLHRAAVGTALVVKRQDRTRRDRERQAGPSAVDQVNESSWEDIKDHVDMAIDGLPDDLRVPLVAHFLDGYDQAEIAADLGISQSAVSRRISKAVEGARKHLRKSGLLVSAGTLAMFLSTRTTEAAPATLAAELAKLSIAGFGSSAGAVSSAGMLGALLVALSSWQTKLVGVLAIAVVGALSARSVMRGRPPDAPEAAASLAAPTGTERSRSSLPAATHGASGSERPPVSGATPARHPETARRPAEGAAKPARHEAVSSPPDPPFPAHVASTNHTNASPPASHSPARGPTDAEPLRRSATEAATAGQTTHGQPRLTDPARPDSATAARVAQIADSGVDVASTEDEARPQLLLQTAHSSWAVGLAYTPDGRYLLSGGWDGVVKIWDAETKQLVGEASVPECRVWALAITPDGKSVAIQQGGDPPRIEIHDIPGGRLRQSIDGWQTDGASEALSLAVSPDGRYVAAGGGWSEGEEFAKFACDTKVRIFDRETGRLVRTVAEAEDNVWAITFLADGERVAWASGDGVVSVHDVGTGDKVHSFLWHSHGPMGMYYAPRAVAFSPDGERLAAGMNTEAKVWEVQTGAEALQLSVATGVRVTAFSPDGTTLACAGTLPQSTVTLWDAQTGEPLGEFPASEAVWGLAFSPDGHEVSAALMDGSISSWGRGAPDEPTRLTSIVSRMPAVTFSRSGRLLATGDACGTVAVWDLSTGQPRSLMGARVHTPERYDTISDLAISDDEDYLLAGAADGSVTVWDIANRRRRHVLIAAHDGVYGTESVAISPDGTRIASGGADDTVKIWDAATGACLHVMRGYARQGGGLAFSPDGRLLAAGDENCDIRVWDVESGDPVRKLEGHLRNIVDLSFGPEGRRLVAASAPRGGSVRKGSEGSAESCIRVWDLTTGQTIHRLDAPTWAALLTPDGSRIASTSVNGRVTIWDAQTGEQLRQSEEDPSRPETAALSADGTRLASGGAGEIRLWSTDDGRLLAKLTVFRSVGDDPPDWLVTTPGGYYMASPGAERAIAWRVGDEIRPAEALSKELNRPDLVQKAIRGEEIAGRHVPGQQEAIAATATTSVDGIAKADDGEVRDER